MILVGMQMGFVMMKITKKHASLTVGTVVDQMLILITVMNVNALNEENKHFIFEIFYKNKIFSFSEY